MAGLRTVLLGFVGSTLDQGKRPDRWQRWRPSVDLCRHPDLRSIASSCSRIRRTRSSRAWWPPISRRSRPRPVRTHALGLKDPWDFEEVYEALAGWVRAYPFVPERERYLVHITTGTHVV